MLMKSQWDCVLQNLGEWRGSFTLLSAEGALKEDIPSLISLEGVNDDQSIHLDLKRFYPVAGSSEPECKQIIMDFSAPGAGAMFFESGAFSEGSLHFAPNARFGAESCLVDQDRRLRLVQIFGDGNQFERLTLIREQRVGTDAPERSSLGLNDLFGDWQGNRVTLYPARREIVENQPTRWQLSRQSEFQLLLDETVTITVNQSLLTFDQEGQLYQTLLLPDGASSTCPVTIRAGQAFFLEVGWLRSPTCRQRLIRDYNSNGEWNSLTWIVEHKLPSGEHHDDTVE
jgi:Domain of unknown function (DUF3598)